MLYFFRLANVPDGSSVEVALSGKSDPVGATGSFSVDGSPTLPWDVTKPLPLRAPHDYDADIDLVAVAKTSFTITAKVTTPKGAQWGSSFSQAITASTGDLNTVHCDFTMAP